MTALPLLVFYFDSSNHSISPFLFGGGRGGGVFCNRLWYNPLTNNLSLGKETLTFSPALAKTTPPLAFFLHPYLPLSLSLRHSKQIDTLWGFLLLSKLIQCNPGLSASCSWRQLQSESPSNKMIINGPVGDVEEMTMASVNSTLQVDMLTGLHESSSFLLRI